MAIDPENIVPARGSIEDWSGDNEEKKLKEKKSYAKKMNVQHNQAYPNFAEKFAGILSESNSVSPDNEERTHVTDRKKRTSKN